MHLTRRSFLAAAAAAAGMSGPGLAFQGGRYRADPQSLNTHPLPDWFADGKLGIFLHWGLYSVPGFAPKGRLEDVLRADYDHAMVRNPYSEDYMNAMRDPTTPTAAYHRTHYGDMPYAGFKPMFEAGLARWDPAAWAREFRMAGGHYVVLTAKYADGYCLWPSRHRNPHMPDWQSDRDVVGELAAAVRHEGMKFGVYFSGGLDWSWHAQPQRTLGEYIAGTPGGNFPQYSEAQLRELIERYEIDILWNDIIWCNTLENQFQLFADYYNRIPQGVVNDRFSPSDPAQAEIRPEIARGIDQVFRARVAAGEELFGADRPPPPHCDFTTPEWVQFTDIRPRKWEVCRGMAYSWGFNRTETEEDHIAPDTLLFNFIDAVSKNGNMLLNVGPTGDGQIPDMQLSRLRALGEWLRPNGEAIFGTRPWTQAEAVTSDGMPVRFTRKDGTLYMIVMGRPARDELRIRGVTLAGPARLLDGRPVRIDPAGDEVVVELPQGSAGSLAPAIAIPSA